MKSAPVAAAPRAAVEASGLSKLYRVGLSESLKHKTLTGAITSMISAPLRNYRRIKSLNTFGLTADADDLIWALRDVSFSVQPGETVGIIGRNGAGKSTLLKILARVTEPTRGRAVIRGRVSSLLEVGTGFHNELTGRDNVFMNGTILGMSTREIVSKFDQIVAFSGVEKYIDTPIKWYSSGMKVRLAFSVAAHLDPEILIIDEVLAVGDVEFQQKCLRTMKDVASTGRTVLFVSHDMTAVRNLCRRGIVIEKGSVMMDSTIEEAARYYAQSTSEGRGAVALVDRADRVGSGTVRCNAMSVTDQHGGEVILMGQPLVIEADLMSDTDHPNVNITLAIKDSFGRVIYHLVTREHVGVFTIGAGRQMVQCAIDELPLLAGEYTIGYTIRDGRTREIFDRIDEAIHFEIIASDVFGTGMVPQKGVAYARSTWSARALAMQNTQSVGNQSGEP